MSLNRSMIPTEEDVSSWLGSAIVPSFFRLWPRKWILVNWAFRDPLLKVILCLSASKRKELTVQLKVASVCVSEQEGKDLSVGISRGLIIGLYICTAEWCLSIRMMWFQFEALGSVTLGNGHLQSELPVPGSVFLAVWFSHFVQWVHICIGEGMLTRGSWNDDQEIFEDSVSVTLSDLFKHFWFWL